MYTFHIYNMYKKRAYALSCYLVFIDWVGYIDFEFVYTLEEDNYSILHNTKENDDDGNTAAECNVECN